MPKYNVKRWLFYALRWQLSTPILAICVIYIRLDAVWTVIVANLIGACAFYYFDKYIFKDRRVPTPYTDKLVCGEYPYDTLKIWAEWEAYYGRYAKAAKIRAARDRMVERRYKWLNRQKGG